MVEGGEDCWSKSTGGDSYVGHWGMGWKDRVSTIAGEKAAETVTDASIRAHGGLRTFTSNCSYHLNEMRQRSVSWRLRVGGGLRIKEKL